MSPAKIVRSAVAEINYGEFDCVNQEQGMAFADIARIPEKEMLQHGNDVIEKLLAQ